MPSLYSDYLIELNRFLERHMARIATMWVILAEYSSGSDALYKINYTLKHKLANPKEFYKFINNITKLNDELCLYADQGNALVLVKDYKETTR